MKLLRKDAEKVPPVDVLDHVYVPKHELLHNTEKKTLLERWHATPEQLPRILVSDPVAKEIGAKPGDIVKIIRESPTAGEITYYRFVVEG